MAVIHQTTLTPGKLELISAWLPDQPWYQGSAGTPQLERAGGFRLDDPDGEVGLECMVVADTAAASPAAYHVPLTYRGAPMEAPAAAFLGTAEHGVLGTRWIYDGAYDPVLAERLLALIAGAAEPQAQRVSNTPELSVARHFAGDRIATDLTGLAVTSSAAGTDILVTRAAPRDGLPADLTVRIIRRLLPQYAEDTHSAGWVTAPWQMPDGTEQRGEFAVLLP